MKSRRLLAMLCLLPAAALAQTTQNYPDASGELAAGIGNHPHIDIASVDVTVDETATNITFKVNLVGNPSATNSDWGKYMVGIRSNPGGTVTGNGWGRPIHMAGGMTHWLAGWADGGNGGQVWAYSSSWSNLGAVTVAKDTSSFSFTTTVASLNLSPGEQFSFDVYTSGGNGSDGAVDALSSATASIGGWGDPYTTLAVGGTPNPARTFTMPGTPDYGTWIAGFSLTGNDALPGTDYDNDGLTNQQEFALDIGLDPTVDDCDGDDLKDGWETLTGVFIDGTHTGTNPMDTDTDGDGMSDGFEALNQGEDYVRDPNHFNYEKIVVPGTFNLPTAWDATGTSDPSNVATVAGTGITEQFQWSLDQRLNTPKATVTFKFTAGSWATNWGATATAGKAGPGGGDINRVVGASGIHRIGFNTATLDYTFTRPSFANAAAFLAAYGLASGADQDSDGINNEAEFTANTDPYNADSDDDDLSDAVDPEPLVVAPESREVRFQVNMSVASQSYFTPGTSVVRVIGQFNSWNITTGVVLSDPDSDGIYTGTLAVGGFEGAAFGAYKFYINGGPDGGYETGADRNFNLGPDGVLQVLPVVYYSNIGPPAGFDAWITNYPGLSDATRTGDPDGDGATNEEEFLFGTSPAAASEHAVTVTREAGGIRFVWLQRSTGATYVLKENNDMADEWTAGPVTPTATVDQAGVPADYTRMEALVPLSGTRNFIRVDGAEN